jgi:hypothetical protein
LPQEPYDLPIWFKTTSEKYYLKNGDRTDADLREIADREAEAKYPRPERTEGIDRMLDYWSLPAPDSAAEQYLEQCRETEKNKEEFRQELLKNLVTARDKANAYNKLRNGDVPANAPFLFGKTRPGGNTETETRNGKRQVN